MKQSSFYHLLLTLGVILLIVIYCPLESFAISAVPSDLSKPDGVRDCKEAKKIYSKGLALADNSDEEAQFYLKAIELCQDFSEAYNKLGEVYKSQGKYDLAIREFMQARRTWHFAAPVINLGEIYRMQGRYDLAETEFVEAVRIRPDSHEAWNQLKYIRKRLGEYDAFSEMPPGEPTPTAIFTRIPGVTLPKGTWAIDLIYKYWYENSVLTQGQSQSIGPPPFFGGQQSVRRRRDVNLWILGLRYGLTNNFTIGLRPRYVKRTGHYFRQKQEIKGLGDTLLLMKYHLWGQRRTHISLFHLLSIPTGDEDASVEGPIIQQGIEQNQLFKIPLGSGSFGFTPGIAISMGIEPLTMLANVSYLFTDSVRVADEFRCDLAFIFPRFHDFEAMLELNFIWSEDILAPTLAGGEFFKIPGEQTLFVSPGMQIFLPHQYKIEMGFQLPVIKPGATSWLENTVFHVGLKKDVF